MIQHVFRLSSLLIMALLIVGCSPKVKAPIEARQDPYLPPQIGPTSEELRRKTAMHAPEVTRDAQSGILYVQLPIRATTNRQLRIQYRFSFFDSHNQEISKTGWLSKTLAPNVPDRISGNSLSPAAVDFQIDIREAQ